MKQLALGLIVFGCVLTAMAAPAADEKAPKTLRVYFVGMYELNQQMKAGKVPGNKDIHELFADGIHLNNVGSYVVGCTYFATLYKQNPKGLPSAPYKVEDAKLAGIIQDLVWKVVSDHELAGVKGAIETATLKSDQAVDVEIARLGNPIKSESAAAVKALVKIGKPAAPALVKALSDSRSDVRAFAAEALRSILAADPSNVPNWHSEAFWKQRIAQLKGGMPLEEALKILLPELSPAERIGRTEMGVWSGTSGWSNYRLDDYWAVGLCSTDFGKEKLYDFGKEERKPFAPRLERSVIEAWVAPPAKYTGEWVTWHVNGQKAKEIQCRDGQYDGTFTVFSDDASKSYQQHFTAGICQGTDTGWHRNGKKSYEGQYDHGKQVGTWRWWDENGKERSVQEYEDGKVLSIRDE